MSVDDPSGARRFATTRWSVVVAAGDGKDTGESRAALETLCTAYWYPLYAFARSRGADMVEAQDLTQGFFATLLEKGYVRDADREKGRFRAFLVTAFRRYTGKEREKAGAQKRGGGRTHLSLDFEQGEDRFRLEPADTMTPERIFERRWALTLLDRVLGLLSDEWDQAGRAEHFAELRKYLGGSGTPPTHADTARLLGMTEGAVKVTVHRLRKRYRALLRAAIEETVASPEDVDDEIRHLFDALG